MAADALFGLGRFGDSLVHLRWLIAMQDKSPAYNDVMRSAIQYRYCCALLWAKAPRQDLDREVDILRSRFSGSSFIEVMDSMIAQEDTGHDR
jgi:hypothetical protein